jgi:hypothetical protein
LANGLSKILSARSLKRNIERLNFSHGSTGDLVIVAADSTTGAAAKVGASVSANAGVMISEKANVAVSREILMVFMDTPKVQD